MNGIDVRIVEVTSRDTELGTENPHKTNSGAIELVKDGQRIAELVWWEDEAMDIATLQPKLELKGALTYTQGSEAFTSLPIHQLRTREPICSNCGRDLHGYKHADNICRYCAGEAE